MSTRLTHSLIIVTIVLAFMAGIYFYSALPEQIATHWNAAGLPDAYTDKAWGAFTFPVVLAAIYLLYILIPILEPLRRNLDEFRREFNTFIFVIVLFFTYLYGLSLAFNLGYDFNMTSAVIPALAVFFYYIGILLRSARRNWFIGIRTPWTLSSDEVWNRTHRLGGILFKLSAILTLFSLLFPEHILWLSLTPIIASAVFLIFYSLYLYKKLEK